MHTRSIIATAVIATVLLSACSREEEHEGVIPEGYKSAIDKAEGVEGQLDEHMKMRGEEIDESER